MDTNTRTLIRALGGGSAVARLFRIQQPSVVGWMHRGIPESRLQALELMAAMPPSTRLGPDLLPASRIRDALREYGKRGSIQIGRDRAA